MHYIGRINRNIYQGITNEKIITDEVIITDNRIQHIIERRGKEFYEQYHKYFCEIIENPDYIFKDKVENTVIVSKTITHNGENINLVIRIAVEGDDKKYKNSIITAIKENSKRFSQRLRNNRPIYKNVDINE